MELAGDVAAAIVAQATRRIRKLHLPITEELIADVAAVLLELKPDLTPEQALRDARTLLENVNTGLSVHADTENGQ